MPRRDGAGPPGGRGFGRGQGRSGAGRGRGKRGGPGTGPGGYCVCSSCGYKELHQAGIPCASVNCSKCNVAMIKG